MVHEGALARKVTAWNQPRNQAGATIGWRVATDDARSKLERLYPAVLP